MKLPRDLNGVEFAKLLSNYGYSITRQTGSHIRLTTQDSGEHHITIPAHNPLQICTLIFACFKIDLNKLEWISGSCILYPFQ